jgi:hypothetical protein
VAAVSLDPDSRAERRIPADRVQEVLARAALEAVQVVAMVQVGTLNLAAS